MVTPAAAREAVAHLKDEHEMSERRACQLLDCCRMTVRYDCARADDAMLRERMKAIAHERRRFGYRRIHALLRREGMAVNHKRLSGSTARRSCLCASAQAANAPLARARPCLCP
jgi:putative transposase